MPLPLCTIFGPGTSSTAPKTSKNYKRIKSKCRRRNELFVDADFPPDNRSLFVEENKHTDIVWKRPGELVDDPKLFVEGASPNDITQGILGNCWFVSACSALTHNEVLLHRVIPGADEQEWDEHNYYCGLFQFCFWYFGKWEEVLIDDFLPTKNGQLLFARSRTKNEFWGALLEKAFAKVYGCYENLVGGQLADALQDLSGGVAISLQVQKFLAPHTDESHRYMNHSSSTNNTDYLFMEPPETEVVAKEARSKKLFQTLKQAFSQNALIVAAIAAKKREEIEETLECGLVKGHAYAVTDVRFIDLVDRGRMNRTTTTIFETAETFILTKRSSEMEKKELNLRIRISGRQMMIRLQNPWGEREWNGPWSDGSKEWEQVTETQKKILGITVDEDGEFWMPWESFVEYFTDISICQLYNTAKATIPPTSLKMSRYSMATFIAKDVHYNEWHFFDKWAANGVKRGAPKGINYILAKNFLTKFDEKPKAGSFGETTQAHPRSFNKHREPFITIGMQLLRVELNRMYRIHQAINIVATSEYVSSRSIHLHLKLGAGRYILIPTTYAPREENEFMLRIYSPKNIKPIRLDEDFPTSSRINCRRLLLVIRLRLVEIKMFGLKKEKSLYCRVINENENLRTLPVFSENDEYQTYRYNELFLLFSRSSRQKFRVNVWENRHNWRKRDKEVGSGTLIVESNTNDCNLFQFDIFTTRKSKEHKKVLIGKGIIEYCSYDDPFYI